MPGTEPARIPEPYPCSPRPAQKVAGRSFRFGGISTLKQAWQNLAFAVASDVDVDQAGLFPNCHSRYLATCSAIPIGRRYGYRLDELPRRVAARSPFATSAEAGTVMDEEIEFALPVLKPGKSRSRAI